MSAPQLAIDLRVEEENWRSICDDLPAMVQTALEAAARQTGAASAALDILLTEDAEMHRLNQQWRGKDKPTDVLSFPAPPPPVAGTDRHLGDLALGWETCRADALAMSRPLDRHVSHLLVHGFLHLLGYDHETATDADVMEALEVTILAELGYPDPYLIPHSEQNSEPAQ